MAGLRSLSFSLSSALLRGLAPRTRSGETVSQWKTRRSNGPGERRKRKKKREMEWAAARARCFFLVIVARCCCSCEHLVSWGFRWFVRGGRETVARQRGSRCGGVDARPRCSFGEGINQNSNGDDDARRTGAPRSGKFHFFIQVLRSSASRGCCATFSFVFVLFEGFDSVLFPSFLFFVERR